MKGGLNAHGYTIVEVLIFMAVSGVMFVMAAFFVNGKQSNVEFRQGLYEVNSELRSTINEVSDGRSDWLSYGSSTQCVAGSGGGAPQVRNGLNIDQGANGGANGCIFLGKVVQFDVSNFSPDNAKYYNVFTIAARQVDISNAPVTSFAVAKPIAVHFLSASPTISSKTLTVSKKMPAGLEITNALICSDKTCTLPAGVPVGAIGFFGSFNPALGVAIGSGQSGSQTITTAPIPGSFRNQSSDSMAMTIDGQVQTITPAQTLGNGKYLLLCFQNGTRKGSIVVGGVNGQQFTTQVRIGPMSGVPAC